MANFKIGIPVSEVGGRIGAWSDLVNFAEYFGDVQLLTSYRAVDAIFLPGGADVNPARYSQKVGWKTSRPDPHLEMFDEKILPRYVGKIPVIGICRGLQTLNVLYGGSLHQHLWINWYSKHDNDLVDKIIPDPVHGGNFKPFFANSFHHQAIDKLGAGLRPLAWSSNCLESISSRRDKVFAVQWHPERMTDQITGEFSDKWSINKIIQTLES